MELSYIEELGIGLEEPTADGSDNNTNSNTSDANQDGLNNSDNTPTQTDGDVKNDENGDTTESVDTEALVNEVEMLKKRISDKDSYINELREQSKHREEQKQEEAPAEKQGDESFWEDPEKAIAKLNDTIKLQQLQIQETVYANTVDDYWKTVNPKSLQEAVALDRDFAVEFNGSNEPYKVAYEYLSKKSETTKASRESEKEKLRQEILKELNVKEQKEAPPIINRGASSSSTSDNLPEDGFAAVFGVS